MSREGFLFCISVRAVFISTRDLDAGLKSGCVNVRGLNICLYCIKKISQDCMNTFQNCNVTFHYFFPTATDDVSWKGLLFYKTKP